MTDFETLGAFYLGKRYDIPTRARGDDVVLYDAKDLTTHAVIIGMTGSGKTGLGVGLLEEALIDKVPVIAIDPKGDLGNLALRFPDFAPSDFEPWVDAGQAAVAGLSAAQFAERQAYAWRNGLAEWGQDSARVARLEQAADVTIYTPGSTAGRPLSLLRAFVAPPSAVREDSEALREHVDATATGILSLLGIEADPMASREHILLANILADAWNEGRDLDLAGLIGAIQSPPFTAIGVMPLDTVFPPKDRMELAMRLNNLLAAPGFQNWLKGEPLDTASLLYDANGKPRGSIISIAHLGDAERMFFVTLLLADILAWTRAQPGTGSLRAILYIDELFGYMPPVANPPSKRLLLTLLKQARAYGLGVVLATQNPVDLDYRGLSNTGTWFIGRLQTERDKARVMEGLEGASGGQAFDRAAMEETIAGLGKRVFLLHSVHEPAPVVFETRWTMSFLAGPMTREQIKRVQAHSQGESQAQSQAQSQALASEASGSAGSGGAGGERGRVRGGDKEPAGASSSRQPVLPPDVPQYFLPPQGDRDPAGYNPAILAVADVSFASAKHGIMEQRRVTLLCGVSDGPIPVEWDHAIRVSIDPGQLERAPRAGATFAPLPKAATSPRSYAAWTKAFQRWVVSDETVELYGSPALKLTSEAGESERDFRIRLQVASREARDAKVDLLRGKYATKMSALQERIRKAEQAVAREESQASQANMNSVLSVGGALLGAVFGRGKIGTGTIGRAGTAVRGVGRAAQQRGDVTRANESAEALRTQYREIEGQLQGEIDALDLAYDSQREELQRIAVKAKAGDVGVQLLALAWVPYAEDGEGMALTEWR